jgi:NTE family protein
MTQSEPEEKTAFVLAGGGSLGAVQVGMLAELVGAGVRPDIIVGVSAGALNGAFLAFDPSLRMVEQMAVLWSRMTTREVLGLSWRSLLGLLGLRDHIASPEGIRSLLKRELPGQTSAETSVPLHLVCAELVTGEKVVISSGNVADAVIASTAIPGVFPPVAREGRYLVDGAVASCTPISVAAALGATRIIVLPCGFACALNNVSKHAIGRAMHAITLLGSRQLRRDFEHYSKSVVMRIAPPICPLSQSAYDYSKGAQLIERARDVTRTWITAGGLDCGDFPIQLAMTTMVLCLLIPRERSNTFSVSKLATNNVMPMNSGDCVSSFKTGACTRQVGHQSA